MRSSWQVSRPSSLDTKKANHNVSANMSGTRRVDDVLDEVAKQQREIHIGERVRARVGGRSNHSNGSNDHDRVAVTTNSQGSFSHNYAYLTRASSVSLSPRREQSEAASESFAVGDLISTESTWSMHTARRGGEEAHSLSESQIPFHSQSRRGNSASSLASGANSMRANSMTKSDGERIGGIKKEEHEKRAPPQSSLSQHRPLEHPSQFASYLRTSGAPVTAASSSILGGANKKLNEDYGDSRQNAHGGAFGSEKPPRRFNANPAHTIKGGEANYKDGGRVSGKKGGSFEEAVPLPSDRSSIAKSESARSSTMSTVVVSAPPSPPTQRASFLSPSASPDPNNYMYVDRGNRNPRRIHEHAADSVQTSQNHDNTRAKDTYATRKSIAVDADDDAQRKGRSTNLRLSQDKEVVGTSVSRLIAESEARRSASAQALKQLHSTFNNEDGGHDSTIDRHHVHGEGGWGENNGNFSGVGASGPKSQHVVVFDTASPARSNAAYLHFDPHYMYDRELSEQQQQRSTNTPPRESGRIRSDESKDMVHAGKSLLGREEKKGLATTTRPANVGAVHVMQSQADIAAAASSVELNSVAASRHRREVLETDNEIRRAYGVPRGNGASVIQVDALVAALASAMVLLKKYESQEEDF